MMTRRIFSLIKKEFLIIWRDPKSRMLIILPPLMQLFVFAYTMTMEIRNIDVAVLDRCNTYESRELISRFQNSKWFRKFIFVNNEKEIKEKIETQKAQIALEINSDFSSNIKRGKSADVQVITDGRQTNTAAIAGSYAANIINEYSAEFEKGKKAQIDMQIRSWYNPNLEYMYYTLASLVVLLAMVITLLLTSMSIARERELGTFDQLIVSPCTPFEILLGKTIAPMGVAMCLATFMALIAVFYFKMPFRGSITLYLLSTIAALLSITGVGLFISALSKTQQQAILGAFTFQTPASLLSGFISPIEDMPRVFQYITLIDPLRYYMVIGKGIFFKGMGFYDVMANTIPLILIAVVTLGGALWLFNRQLD